MQHSHPWPPSRTVTLVICTGFTCRQLLNPVLRAPASRRQNTPACATAGRGAALGGRRRPGPRNRQEEGGARSPPAFGRPSERGAGTTFPRSSRAASRRDSGLRITAADLRGGAEARGAGCGARSVSKGSGRVSTRARVGPGARARGDGRAAWRTRGAWARGGRSARGDRGDPRRRPRGPGSRPSSRRCCHCDGAAPPGPPGARRR